MCDNCKCACIDCEIKQRAINEQQRIIDELQKENDRLKSIKESIYRWATKHQGGHF
jgi:hypothetical protein